jgi:hypothetical protein
VFVSCKVIVLSGRGLCDGPIPHPEESYRLRCVLECDEVKSKTLYTYCEQIGRRGKDYKTKLVYHQRSIIIIIIITIIIKVSFLQRLSNTVTIVTTVRGYRPDNSIETISNKTQQKCVKRFMH